MVQWLVERAEVNADCDGSYAMPGWTAMHFAANNGHAECVQLLLAANAGVDNSAKSGQTPLMCVASNGRCPILKVPLEVGDLVQVSVFQLTLNDCCHAGWR